MSRFHLSIQKSTHCSTPLRWGPCRWRKRPRKRAEICFTSPVTALTKMGRSTFPLLGKVDVLGLTLNEAHSAVKMKVSELFTNYHLQVKLGQSSLFGPWRIQSARYKTRGHAKPSDHLRSHCPWRRFESWWPTGEQIRLIRQHPNGTKIHSINLLDESVVGSPYYFIQPNDVLYAEPLPQRSWGIGITGAQTLNTIVSTLSTSAALILSIISLSR